MNQDIFPVGTYAYLAELVVVFLVTDFLRYKPIIIVDGIFAILTWSLLIWGKDVLTMQVIKFHRINFSMALSVNADVRHGVCLLQDKHNAYSFCLL